MYNFFVTGCKTGLSKEIIDNFGQEDDTTIVCRKNYANQDNIKFKKLDLNKIADVCNFDFSIQSNKKMNVLINNSATLGKIANFFRLESDEVLSTFNINLIAPIILMQAFIRQNINFGNSVLVVNIGSKINGLQLPNLVPYSISKLGLVEITNSLSNEIVNENISNCSLISIDPGMIDTPMQQKLRSCDKKEFNIFGDAYSKNKLKSPKEVGMKIVNFIKQNKWEAGKNYHVSQL